MNSEYFKFLTEEDLELYNKKKSEYNSLEEDTLKKAKENFIKGLPKGPWIFRRNGYDTLLYDSIETFIIEHGDFLIRPSNYRNDSFIYGLVILRPIPLVTKETAFCLSHNGRYDYYDSESDSNSDDDY